MAHDELPDDATSPDHEHSPRTRPRVSEPGPERRSRPRIPLHVEVGLESDSNFYTGFSEDLSDGGLFVATYELRALGTKVAIVLDLPDGRRVRATGRVAWLRDPPDRSAHPGMGVSFEDIGEDDRGAILAFAREREPLFFDA